jgi:hypothetical protein
MRTIRILAAAAGVFGVLAAPAALASAQQESAAEVIEKLQSEGYTVRIDKIGTAPLDQCVVTSVRNKQQFTQLVPLLGGNNDGILFPAIISQPVSVSLDCSG